MAVLELAAVLSLASACVPSNMPKLRQRMVAHVMVESGFDPLAIRDNATNASYRPRTIGEAQEILTSLRGHPLDAGISQVTSANWEKTGLRSPRLLFNATANFCAGTIILAQDYEAACRYNTGKPNCENGYPEAVARAQAIIARSDPGGVSKEHVLNGRQLDIKAAARPPPITSATARQSIGAQAEVMKPSTDRFTSFTLPERRR